MNQQKLDTLKHFLKYCKKELTIQSLPPIKLINDPAFVLDNRSFGGYYPNDNIIKVYCGNRIMADYLRSLAHELTHHRQRELNMIQDDSGEAGSEIENEANAMAGIIMRDYGQINPNIYEVSNQLQESKQLSLQEKIVKVPQQVTDLSDAAYQYIETNKKKLSKKLNRTSENAYIDPRFVDYFEVTDMKTGENRPVSLGMYDDPEDGSGGGVEVIKNRLVVVVNLAKVEDAKTFIDTVKHEIIHTMDPKVMDPAVFAGLEPRDAEPQEDYPKYVKSPREFDAFSTVLITKLKDNLREKSSNLTKDSKALIQLLSDLLTQDLRTVALNPDYKDLIKYFTYQEDTDKAMREFINQLGMLKTWATKPTLYKQFLKRLGTEI